MTAPAAARIAVLLVRAAGRVCALPLANVVEVMRPLPEQHLPGFPPFVRGLAVIRGAPVPVVDLTVLLTGAPAATAGRFISLRSGEKRMALAVESVLGRRDLDATLLQRMPLLERKAGSEMIAAVGALDERLLTLLQTDGGFLDEIWRRLDTPSNVA